MEKKYFDNGLGMLDYEVPIPTENAKEFSKKETNIQTEEETYTDIAKKANEVGFLMDSCGLIEYYYDNGSFNDLCGLSLEDAIKAYKRGNYVAQDNNSVFVSLTKHTNNYEIVVNTMRPVGDDISINIIIDGMSNIANILKNESEVHTGIFVDNKYQVIDNIVVTTKDTTFDYVVVNLIKDGFFKLCYVVDGKDYYTESVKFGSPVTRLNEPTKRGHTFSGWSNIPNVMPEEDITINGVFSINYYDLTYKVDGEIYKATTSIAFDSKITPLKHPSKEGYTFSGWHNEPTNMPDNDVIVEGEFTINKYKISYYLDGVLIDSKIQEYSSAIERREQPTKIGYTFSGWNGEVEKVPAHDVNIYGRFDINHYDISYFVDGEFYKKITQNYNTLIPLPQLTKEGYTFDGWDVNDGAVLPDNNIEIHGSFTINQYKLTYIDYDNTPITSFTLDYNTKIEEIEAHERYGYTFKYWDGILSNIPARDLTVKAVYEINKFSVKFMSDIEGDDVYVENQNVAFGSKIVIPHGVPVKTGYDFVGWENFNSVMPNQELIIRPIYSIKKFDIIFVCPTSKDNSEYVESYRLSGIEYNTNLTEYFTDEQHPYPTEEDIFYEGYYIEEGYIGSWPLIEGKIEDNMIIMATYEPKSFTITFNDGKNDIETTTVEFRTSIPECSTSFDIPVGERFVGWSGKPADGLMIANDIILTAVYEKIVYTITYKVDGIEVHTENHYYGDTLVKYNYYKEHYTISEWDKTLDATMPPYNIEMFATSSINKNKLTINLIYNNSTETLFDTYEELIDYNTPLNGILEDVKTLYKKEGYDFDRWVMNGDIYINMPDNEITIDGYYNIQRYTVEFFNEDDYITAFTLDYGTVLEEYAKIAMNKVQITDATKVFIWILGNDVNNIKIKENMVIKGKIEDSFVYYGIVPVNTNITEEFIYNNLYNSNSNPDGIITMATSAEFSNQNLDGITSVNTFPYLTQDETDIWNEMVRKYAFGDVSNDELTNWKYQHLYSMILIYPYTFTLTKMTQNGFNVLGSMVEDEDKVKILGNQYHVLRYTAEGVIDSLGQTCARAINDPDATLTYVFQGKKN